VAGRKIRQPPLPSRWGREAAARSKSPAKQVERGDRLDRRVARLHGKRDRGDQLGDQGDARKAPPGTQRGSSPSRPSMRPFSTLRVARGQGVEVTYLPVGSDGLSISNRLKAAVDERVALVAVMLVNNEIGVIQPIGEIAGSLHAIPAR
jgi:cysteine desulfurase